MKDIVLAVNYRPEVMVSVLKKSEEEFGINIHFSVETEPLGTGMSRPCDLSWRWTRTIWDFTSGRIGLTLIAGPLALARDILGKDDTPFFVLNSDVTCTYPFEAFR